MATIQASTLTQPEPLSSGRTRCSRGPGIPNPGPWTRSQPGFSTKLSWAVLGWVSGVGLRVGVCGLGIFTVLGLESGVAYASMLLGAGFRVWLRVGMVQRLLELCLDCCTLPFLPASCRRF